MDKQRGFTLIEL
ncbi:TPA: prepilin-type N-terminal cleavage/methylation domain-containing protein, partial [Escherichia coli]|nr:prepilin-type N-terminal cleavage/methylation domain-containing protein [Escherichia coli]HCS1903039.1 prepilin-type N-terminal cleavage/methylation domain-containing protein [Shigella boydii]